MVRPDIRGPIWDVKTGIPDLSGKVAIVTGANALSGVGYHVAQQLALHGAKVYVGARSLTKASDAISEMQESPEAQGKTLSLKPFVADLGDFTQVREAARAFIRNEDRLDILVNNAGLLARPLDKDANGISVSFATNHLGPFLLTLELLPILKKTAASHPGVRVVAVSSSAHTMPGNGVKYSSLDDFNAELGSTDDPLSNLKRYGLSKLANILFMKELQQRFDADDVDAIAVSLHPGGVRTIGSINYVGQARLDEAEAMYPLDGALTPLFAATNPIVWEEKDKFKGKYLMPFGVVSPEDMAEDGNDEELAKELWKTSTEVIHDVLGK